MSGFVSICKLYTDRRGFRFKTGLSLDIHSDLMADSCSKLAAATGMEGGDILLDVAVMFIDVAFLLARKAMGGPFSNWGSRLNGRPMGRSAFKGALPVTSERGSL